MRREELLEKGYTEEQVTDILNTFHSINKENETLKADLLNAKNMEAKYNDAQKQLEDIQKASMNDQQRLELEKKEIEKNLRESKLIVNKAKAKEVLAGLDIDEELISNLVNEDEATTIKNATLLKNKFEAFKETVAKQTKDSLASLDVKPNLTNVPQESNAMTWDKFQKLSDEEQSKWANENPEEFNNL